MNRQRHILIDIILLVVAVGLTLAGSALVLIYLWDGILVRLGEPDQSPVFWYLPVLFIGVLFLVGGILLIKRTIKVCKK
jgi:H+/Cl- antiporter ClcA